jgi:hypothetical protein
MSNTFKAGDRIRLRLVDDWLFEGLLPHEKADIRACVGKETHVHEVDAFGGIWVSFAKDIVETEPGSLRGGPTFLVQYDWLEPISTRSKVGQIREASSATGRPRGKPRKPKPPPPAPGA